MTSMVAKPCSTGSQFSQEVTVQENGSRNKRKFRADPPLIDVNKVIPVHQNECTSNKFSGENFEIVQSQLCNACDMCRMKQEASGVLKLQLGLPCPVGPHEATEVFHDPDWNDLNESELGELVLSAMDTVFKNAIKKVVTCGYSEEVVTKAILRSGICYGCNDTLSNIIDNTLAFLKSGQEIDGFSEPYFEDLQQMEKYILAELICVLKEIRPFFSTGDAMWCLLLCDMNVSHDITSTEPDLLKPSKTNSSVSCCTDSCLSEASNMTSIPSQPFQSEAATSLGISKSKTSVMARGPCPQRLATTSNTPDTVENIFSLSGTSHLPVFEEKFINSRKFSGITKREYILGQESLHLDKHHSSHGSKGSSRTGKFSSFADSSGVKARNSFRISREIGIQVPQPDTNKNISTNIRFPPVPSFNLESDSCISTSSPKSNIKSLVPTADTKLSLSLPAKSCSDLLLHSCNSEAPLDKKDEMIVKLVPRSQELQNQLEEWTEWANKKVMQVARRLGEDKAELKALKQEKEEMDRLKKEKQVLEENTLKKLSEIDNALFKAGGQVEKTNAAVCRLEVENATLRRETEAAKSHAAESAASFQEVSRREKSSLLNSHLWEKQKSVYQEELAMEKRIFLELQQKLEQEEALRDQLEGRWKQENQVKEEILSQCTSMKEEKEQFEASTKSKEESMKSAAENKVQKRKDEIQKLEKEISQLRLKTDSSKIAALKRGIDGSYLSKQTDNTNVSASIECFPFISKMVTDIGEYTGHGCVKRERECVMCLSEEMSVVFLPCAHQVVCTVCNELHEKRGMDDCPSCRSPIQQRICVRYACS